MWTAIMVVLAVGGVGGALTWDPARTLCIVAGLGLAAVVGRIGEMDKRQADMLAAAVQDVVKRLG